MSELSPAAKAVFRAFSMGPYSNRCSLAAALRALAAFGEEVQIRTASGMAEFDLVVRVSHIHAIATELENADD